MADRVDELGVQGVVEEVTDLARRRPVLFLAGAATAGILVGRMARAGKEAQSADGSSSPAVAAGATTPGWGETANGAPVATAPTFDPPPRPPAPVPLAPPVAPVADPVGPASGWVGR
jgi:hypothetical protein